MKIQKYHFWLAFFFFIFGMTFSMIVWTVKSAVNTPVYEDKSFMTSYQDVDDNYNKMVIDNAQFNQKYETIVSINGREVGLELSDLRYGQRSLEKKSSNQNLLKMGENSISLTIKNLKSGAVVKGADIKFQITRPVVDMSDINLEFKPKEDTYHSSFTIDKIGKWNIISKVIVGDDTGYLYIKTNTQK